MKICGNRKRLPQIDIIVFVTHTISKLCSMSELNYKLVINRKSLSLICLTTLVE